MNTNLNTDVYNADIYLRLSREDGDKEESDSITNQKELILEFLKSRKDIRVHAIRADDGYSGVNFDRPAFQQMLEDIKNGKGLSSIPISESSEKEENNPTKEIGIFCEMFSLNKDEKKSQHEK